MTIGSQKFSVLSCTEFWESFKYTQNKETYIIESGFWIQKNPPFL